MNNRRKESQAPALRYRHFEDVEAPSHVTNETRHQAEMKYRYNHLNEKDREVVEGLLKGALPLAEIPRIKSKVIKIFISSTFTDFVEERNALAKNVYPKLRKYCRDRYGVDFHAVDMRWGVPVEATNDHSVTDMCLNELEHCRDLSIGPNFAALVGQRYGFIPVPPAVTRLIFESVKDNLVANGHDVTLLESCYVLDQNVTPNVHRLLEVNKCCELTQSEWPKIERDLRLQMQEGARLAMANGDISEEVSRQLTRSVTEHEVQAGLLAVKREHDRANNSVLFFRNITDLHDNLDSINAGRHSDLIPGANEVDSDAHVALKNMEARMKESVPRLNTACSNVQWTESGIDPVKHHDHLDMMCNHFYHTIKILVDRNMDKMSTLATDELYHEAVQHWSLVKCRCATFVGRSLDLLQLKKYLTGDSHQPLVVHGESGVGKTSFMAKAVTLCKETFKMKCSIIPRFVGVTPKSNNIQQLLYSVCHHMAFVTGGYRNEVPEDYKSLKIHFIDKVQRGDFPGVVIIFLDSLDQLSTANGGEKLDWLPSRLASNVKIIVSTVPKRLGILDRLKGKIDDPMIEICPLPEQDCKQIMQVLLETNKRSLTLPQWRIVQEAFKHCTLPLFITLTFQEAARWRSFDDVDPKCLEYTVDKSINKLFDRLEARHGKAFVSGALGYITASRNGLSETELEDILSLDDRILNSVFTHWKPPIRRIPPNLWPRLYLEINAFLVEREADDIVVLGWYHSQFFNSATDRYLKDYVDLMQIHRNIAEYFMGTYSGVRKKPFTYPERLMNRLGRSDPYDMECRYVPEQPLILQATEISEQFNYRKMTQLPYSLIHSYQFEPVKETCLCNFEWLHTKLKATSLQHLLGDFSLLDDKEANLVADALRMSGSALKFDPDTLGSEITGRLLPHIHRYKAIRQLVKQCDLVSQSKGALVPNCQIYTAPGGPLQYECEMDERVTSAIDVDVFNTQDGILMTAKPFHSNTLKVWELTQGEPRQDMHLPIGEVHPSKDGKFLAIMKGSRQVLIFKTESGEQHGHIDCEYGEVVNISMSNKYLAFNIDRGVGPYVMDLQQAKLVHKFTNQSQTVTLSGDESHLAFNTGTLILVHSLPLMERRCVGQASDIPLQLAFNRTASKCYILTLSKLLQVMLFDPTNRKCRTLDVLSDLDTQEFKLSHTEKYVLVRSLRCLYLVCTSRNELCQRFDRIHPGVFAETMTCFSGANFSPNDSMVVASRYTYIFVWNTENGDPIRILQASISPILKIYTSDTVNKAVALLRDNTLQVWNLDNLDADIHHANEIFKYPIGSVAVSTQAGHILCHDDRHSDIKLVDMATGKTKSAIMQGQDVQRVANVHLFCRGKYGVTRNIKVEDEETPRVSAAVVKWGAVYDDVVWHLDTKKKVFNVENNRFVVFDTTEQTIGFVKCIFHSQFEWTANMYTFISWNPKDAEKSQQPQNRGIDIPAMSEFICPPIIYNGKEKQYLMALIQICNKSIGIANVETSRNYENVLLINNMDRTEILDSKKKQMSDFLMHPEEKDLLASIQVVNSNLVLLLYVKGVDFFDFHNDRGLVIPPDLEKGSILYNPDKDVVVRHIKRVLHPGTDLKICLLSKTSSIRVDSDLRVFSTVQNRQLCQINANLHVDSLRLALDGQYLVGLCKTKRSVHVYRTSDGVKMGHLHIHGKGTCLEISSDERTIVVGCHDGRVLIISLVLDLCDPYIELIQNLESRAVQDEKKDEALLEKDVANVEKRHPELIRLASKIRTDVKMAERKNVSFKGLSTGTALTRRMNRVKSHACCVQ